MDDEFKLQYNLNGHYGSAPWIDIYKDGEHAHHNNALQLVTNLEKFEIEQVKIKARKCGVVKCPDCDGTGYDTFFVNNEKMLDYDVPCIRCGGKVKFNKISYTEVRNDGKEI